MSPGKLAAQVAHASMAWLTDLVRRNAKPQFADPDVQGNMATQLLRFVLLPRLAALE